MNRTISSETLGQGPVEFGRQTGELSLYDGLSTPISDDTIELSSKHAKQISEFTLKAASLYGDSEGNKEPTLVQTKFGLPSLIVRVDATVHGGDIVPYEMEDSPSGQGITDRIHTAVAGAGIRGVILGHYDDLLGDIPTVVVSGMRSHGTDDAVIVGRERYHFDPANKQSRLPVGPVIVKAIPGQSESHEAYLSLQPEAVAPLATEGDKSYLARMGMLREVLSEDDLLMNDDGELSSQVIKARAGSMAMGVKVYLTNHDRSKLTKAGTSTATKLRSTAREYMQYRGGALVQSFVPPIEISNPEGRNRAILRVFVLLGAEAVPKVIGGCYVARQGLIVHGASDAISGAVLYNGDKND